MKTTWFKFLHRIALGLIAVSGILISSCAAPGGPGGGVSYSGGTVGGPGYDARERRILTEARVVGGVAGAAAGAIIANQTDASPWLGAAIGGVAGTLLGDAVGRGQANKARGKRMDNDSLRQAIASARANNDRLAAYNRRVAARIAAIRRAPKNQQAKLAKAELKSVNSAIKETNELAASRQTYVNKIPSSQSNEAAAMNTEIRRGQSQLATLSSYQSDLRGMSTLASN